MEGLHDGGRLAATVPAEHGVRGQEVDELVEVTGLGGGQEGANEGLALLGRRLVAGVMGVKVPAGPYEDLAAVRLALVDDLGSPNGDFSEKAVLVAGGIGITPYRSMLSTTTTTATEGGRWLTSVSW